MNLSIWKDRNKNIIYSIRNYRHELGKPKILPTLVEYFLVNNGHHNLYGELGCQLQEFLKSVDLNHPELDSFLSIFFGYEGLEEIEIIHELAKFCVRKNYNVMIGRLKNLLKFFVKNNLPHHGKTIGNPLITHAYTRFLAKDNIWASRDAKKPQRIQCKKNVFESINCDQNVLDAYHHDSDKSLQLKKELERKKEIFDSMNCVHLSSEIESAIKKIEGELISCNFGFRRITLTAAASALTTILGKPIDVYLEPIKKENIKQNNSLNDFIDSCDNFGCFNNAKAVFDHYATIRSDEDNVGFIVGERDLKTFFIGYYYND